MHFAVPHVVAIEEHCCRRTQFLMFIFGNKLLTSSSLSKQEKFLHNVVDTPMSRQTSMDLLC